MLFNNALLSRRRKPRTHDVERVQSIDDGCSKSTKAIPSFFAHWTELIHAPGMLAVTLPGMDHRPLDLFASSGSTTD